MPIGTGAVYVPADIAPPTAKTSISDQDIIIMDPTAPLTRLIQSGGGWGGNRCNASGPPLISVPIPADFMVSSGSHNDALAVVMPDGQTVVQGQPFARCSAGGPGTLKALVPPANLYGAGILGAHGGSGLSSLGGTILLNQLVPGGAIRHALKVNLDAGADLFPSPGFRWPAIRHDSCAPGCYGGTVPALEMGSLLAIPASVNINALGLQTAPARMLAWTLQNYGAYVADNTSQSAFSIETELSPSGSVVNSVPADLGLSLPGSGRQRHAVVARHQRDPCQPRRGRQQRTAVDRWRWQPVAATRTTDRQLTNRSTSSGRHSPRWRQRRAGAGDTPPRGIARCRSGHR